MDLDFSRIRIMSLRMVGSRPKINKKIIENNMYSSFIMLNVEPGPVPGSFEGRIRFYARIGSGPRQISIRIRNSRSAPG